MSSLVLLVPAAEKAAAEEAVASLVATPAAQANAFTARASEDLGSASLLGGALRLLWKEGSFMMVSVLVSVLAEGTEGLAR